MSPRRDVTRRPVDSAGQLTENETVGSARVAGKVRPERPPPRPRRVSTNPRVALVAPSLSLLALAVFVFVVDVVFISSVEHARAQRVAYDDFRNELSALVAPTGQNDIDGNLLALGTPVAYLTSPALGLEREVVFEGTTASVLAKGPGHRRSSPLPGQPGVSILYGRAWSHGGPFGDAGDLAEGSVITVTTGQGEHVYTVTSLRREGDPVPPPLGAAAEKGRLTLVTATGFPYTPSGVLYVDAALTTPAVPAARRSLTTDALLPAEGALASDSTAWPTVFLTMQGLAVVSLAATWASRRWGPAQAWLVGFPVVGLFALLASREIVRLLPNLL